MTLRQHISLSLAIATLCGGQLVLGQEPTKKSVTAELKEAISEARDKVFPSLVSIVTVREYQADGRHRLTRSGGSGTIVTKDGHIVTNAHVTENGTKFKVILADKREIDAELIGEDPLSDIAVIQLDVTQLAPDEQLPVAKFGDSDKLDIGDYVMAMGAPWGMSRSMSLGVINNNDRVLASFFDDDADYESRLGRDQPTGSYYRWLQHDAAIAPGNSGGPLVNLGGEIVGVNTRGSFFGGDMGFASPSKVVKDLVGDLIAQGEVVRSYTGIRFKPIKTTGHDHGVLANSIVEDSPADQAGLRPGDLITKVDERETTVRYVEDLPGLMRYLADLPVGSTVRVNYERGTAKKETTLVTTKYEKDVGDKEALLKWGMTVQDLTPRMARNRRLPSHGGVLVTSTRAGRPATEAKPSLKYGDVIVAVEGVQVEDLKALMQLYKTMMDQPKLPEVVLIEFERNGGRYLSTLEPDEDEEPPRPREIDKAWIGVEVQPVVKDLATRLELGKTKGFRIVRIYPSTVAASSDLKVGDIITELNGKKLKPRSDKDSGKFQREIKKLDLTTSAQLTVLRTDGSSTTIELALEPTRKTVGEAERVKNEVFDFEVREITFFDIADNRWKQDTHGVLVTEVERGGWAGVGHLRNRDLIIEIEGSKIEDLATFKSAMESIESKQLEKVKFLVMRGIETRFLFIETDWDTAS